MLICVDQPIGTTPEEAQAAFLDPSFYRELRELGSISAPELRSLDVDGEHARLVVGYGFEGQLNGAAAAILDPARLTWAQVSDVDIPRRRTEVTMVPDNYASLLTFSGWYELRSAGPGQCCQHFEADLRVHIPLLGPLAERAIAGSVQDNLQETAKLIERHCTQRGSRHPPGGQANKRASTSDGTARHHGEPQ